MATKYAGQNALNKLMQLMKTALGNKADKTDLDGKLDKTGGTISGNLTVTGNVTSKGIVDGQMISGQNVTVYSSDQTKQIALECTGQNAGRVSGEMSGSTLAYARLAVGTPTEDTDAATKAYVDGRTENYYVSFKKAADGTYSASRTAKEIYEAYQAGKRVWQMSGYERFPITDCTLLNSGKYVAYFTHFEPGNMIISYCVNQESDTAESTASVLVYGIIAPNPGSADNNKFLKVSGSKITYADIPDAVTVDDAISDSSTNPVQNKAIKAELDKKLNKSGGTISGNLVVDGSLRTGTFSATNLGVYTSDLSHGVTLTCDGEGSASLAGETAGTYARLSVGTPTVGNDAATKTYVDNKVSGLQTADQVQTAINSALTGVYTPKGSIAFASLPTAAAGNKGWVYNITDAFTTTSAFVEGTGHTYAAGTNVVCVDAGSGSYKWDVLAGTIDLTELTAAEVQTLWDSI